MKNNFAVWLFINSMEINCKRFVSLKMAYKLKEKLCAAHEEKNNDIEIEIEVK